jgi:hypothetical protein
MIKFFTAKELSQTFNINLARLKRWSREFLPPDPLGGLQSGYARQYNPDEAFTVILGGHLVGDLKLTIPDARQIIRDLNEWLAEHEFYFNFSRKDNSPQEKVGPVKNYQIAIIKRKMTDATDSGFIYRARGIIADDVIDFHGHQIRQLHFTESCIGPDLSESAAFYTESHRVLNISALRDKFLSALAEGKSTGQSGFIS